jgi:hypothetical protein
MNELMMQPQAQAMPVAIRSEMSIADIRKRKELVHELMRDLMVPGQHYGEIPGTDGKPTLLKSGAEMLCMTFRLAASFNVQLRELPNNHREYRVDCTLTSADGSVVATGVGSATTMESKHRWRLRSLKCPTCGQETIRKGRDGYFCGQKLGGCGENFSATHKGIVMQPKGKVENPDVADQWNTVLKIAAKRAHTHATLLATAASDMFVPEDDEDEDPKPEEQKAEAPKLTPKQELLRDCVQMAEALHKAGIGKVDQATLMTEAGVTPPAKWSDLDEASLAKVKAAFAEQLKAGKESK